MDQRKESTHIELVKVLKIMDHLSHLSKLDKWKGKISSQSTVSPLELKYRVSKRLYSQVISITTVSMLRPSNLVCFH